MAGDTQLAEYQVTMGGCFRLVALKRLRLPDRGGHMARAVIEEILLQAKESGYY